jgi:hypothetical protein
MEPTSDNERLGPKTKAAGILAFAAGTGLAAQTAVTVSLPALQSYLGVVVYGAGGGTIQHAVISPLMMFSVAPASTVALGAVATVAAGYGIHHMMKGRKERGQSKL